MVTDEQNTAFTQLGRQHAEDAFKTLRSAGGMSRQARAEKMTDDAYELMTRLGVARADRETCIGLAADAMMARHRELEDETDEAPGWS